MKKSLLPGALALAGLVMILSATLAVADIPRPDNRPDNRNASPASDLKVTMVIDTDDKLKEAKLVIPRAIFQQMQAQANGAAGSQASAASARFFNMTGAQTIMSGIFLSLAFAFGGVWLVRARQGGERSVRALVSLSVSLLLLGGTLAGAAYANAGPPPVARSLTSKILIDRLQYWGAYGDVHIEVVEEGNYIKLTLPRKKITEADLKEGE